jgi:hypothetical protein
MTKQELTEKISVEERCLDEVRSIVSATRSPRSASDKTMCTLGSGVFYEQR